MNNYQRPHERNESIFDFSVHTFRLVSSTRLKRGFSQMGKSFDFWEQTILKRKKKTRKQILPFVSTYQPLMWHLKTYRWITTRTRGRGGGGSSLCHHDFSAGQFLTVRGYLIGLIAATTWYSGFFLLSIVTRFVYGIGQLAKIWIWVSSEVITICI